MFRKAWRPWTLLTVYALAAIIVQPACCAANQDVFGLDFNPDDFVLALPTCVHRLPLVETSRIWRKGIRALFVLNNTQLVEKLNADPEVQRNREAYVFFEDDSQANHTWRGGNYGDTRAAVTPFLAHKHFGNTYKWMLYGDDDTLFYLTGVLKLLQSSTQHYEVPQAITDNVWWHHKHPNEAAPRCLPCGFNTSRIVLPSKYIPRPACSICTRAFACGTYDPMRHACSNNSSTGSSSSSIGSSRTASSGAVTSSSSSSGQSGDVVGQQLAQQARDYAAWMANHVALKKKLLRSVPANSNNPDRLPALDWDQRDATFSSTRLQLRLRTVAIATAKEPGGSGAAGDVGPGGSGAGGGGSRSGSGAMSSRQAEADAVARLALPAGQCVRHEQRLHDSRSLQTECASHSIAPHGGAGMLFSLGLMKQVDPDVAVQRITSLRGCAGGDCLLNKVLWDLMGIGMIDPGTGLTHKQGYRVRSHFVDSNQQMRSLIWLGDPMAALNGTHPAKIRCNSHCRWLIENVAGTHVRAHTKLTSDVVAEITKHYESHAAAYAALQAARSQMQRRRQRSEPTQPV